MKASVEQHLEIPRQLIVRLANELRIEAEASAKLLSSLMVCQCHIYESIERYSIGKT